MNKEDIINPLELLVENEHLLQENQELKAELQLYQGVLKREYEAIHRANDLEEENQELKEVIDKVSYKIENYTTLNPTRIRQELLEILKGGY